MEVADILFCFYVIKNCNVSLTRQGKAAGL